MKIRFLLATFALLSLQGFVWAEDPPNKLEAQKTQKTYKSIFGGDKGNDSTLLADNVKVKSVKKTEALNKAIEESILRELTREENLDYPAIDLYGENSWVDDSVNPIGANHSSLIPDHYDIDCTQFTPPLDQDMRITSHYGYRRRFRRMHYGTDIKLNTGDTVRAAFDGKVRMVRYERRGYGHYVVIRHPNGLETLYAHLSKTIAKPDQVVRAGDPIALGGNTGRSTGSHLHFETRFMGIPINPELIVDFSEGMPKAESFAFQKKLVRGRSYAKSSNSGKSTGNHITTYRIRSGDTLSGIAAKHGTSVSALCRLNGISKNTTLRIGRSLRIS